MEIGETLYVTTREDFRKWLEQNHKTKSEIWLIQYKKATKKPSVNFHDAVEEAMCFGWTESIGFKGLDEERYVTRYTPRKSKSKWSEKNRGLVDTLEKQGRMTEHGRAKVEEAKKNGTWNPPPAPPFSEQDIQRFHEHLTNYEPAYSNYMAMSPSVRGTYTALYCAPKSDETRTKRLAWIVERLNKNLKPM